MNAAVQETVHQFFEAVDRHDWRKLRACLRDEVALGDEELPADEFVAAREEKLDGVRTAHLCSNHAITVDGEHAECACSALILRTDERGRTCDSQAEFRYTLTRAGHRWRIERIAQRVIWERGHADVRR